MKNGLLTFCFFILIVTNLFSQQTDFPKLTGLHLGQKPPGMTPEIFAPGIVSIEDGKEYKPTISPDGTEIFFIRRTPNKRNDCIWHSKLENGVLCTPKIAPFAYRCFEGQPCFSPDGQKLYYLSCRPLSGESELNQMPNLWCVEKTEDGWGEPVFVAGAINEHHPAQISFTSGGTAYFVSNTQRKIFYSVKENEIYCKASLLEGGVNNLEPVGHPTISPDESYIIVDRIYKVNEKLVSDMLISFRNYDNQWTEPVSMKNVMNMLETDIYAAPRITYDGKYLFFEKYDPQTDKGDIYWVDAKIIEELRPKE